MVYAHEATNLFAITHGFIHFLELTIPVFIFAVGLFLIRKWIKKNREDDITV